MVLKQRLVVSNHFLRAGIFTESAYLDDFPQNIKFRPASRANGPQRVPLAQNPAMLMNHFLNQQAADAQNIVSENIPSFSPLRQSTKRPRDNEEDEGTDFDPAGQPKRFKVRSICSFFWCLVSQLSSWAGHEKVYIVP